MALAWGLVLGLPCQLWAQVLPALGAAPAATAAEAASSTHTGTSVDSQPPDLAKGKRAFQRYCSVCHGLRGEGGLGPPLLGVAKRLSPEEITRQLMTPRGSMPRLYPNPVDDKLLIDLRGYLLQMK